MVISLSNNTIAYDTSYAGQYKYSSFINRKPSYIKGEKAIWYHPEREIWLVGHISEHGGNKGAFYASDNFGGLTDCKNQWFYWHENGWKKAGISNGLDIKCTIAGER